MSLFFFKQKTAYEMRISDWSSDVCSSDLVAAMLAQLHAVRDPAPQWRAGRLAAAVRADARDQLLRMRLRIDADGQIWLERLGPKASHMLSNLTAATALVRIPAGVALDTHEVVQWLPLPLFMRPEQTGAIRNE